MPGPRALIRRRAVGWPLAAGLLLALFWCATPGQARAHAGDLDEYGGHFDPRTGGYHYHRPRWDLAKRTKEYLNWGAVGQDGELVGVVVKIERPDAIWLEIPYRPAFQNLALYVSRQNRDDERARVRVWFQHVSPERSMRAQDREYREWFRQKVVYELDRKLRGQQVTVQFTIAEGALRPEGMVLLGEENINLWLVLNGWSFYQLGPEGNAHEAVFQEAESTAKRDKAGLWAR